MLHDSYFMPQNSAEKREKRSRDAINLPARADRVSRFQLGRNLSDVAENREISVADGGEGKEGKDEKERSEGKGFNQEEAANILAKEREREKEESQKSIKSKVKNRVEEGEEWEEGVGEDGGEEGEESKKEKMTIPSEIAAFVLQWEFIFALAGPFFLFILLAEFIALKIFSMFKFSKWKKICTLGNFLLACLTSLIYFLLFMMLMAALQKTGGTKTGIAWFGFKVLASNAWSGFTSFFGF